MSKKKRKKLSKKGELTITGIMGIVITLAFMAMTIEMQIAWVGILLDAVENDTTATLAAMAIIPMEVLMLVLSIVYAARSARAGFQEFRDGY